MTKTQPPPAEPGHEREFHSLSDLPPALGQVSTGPLGSVARKDHISWKNKNRTDPRYWCGWLDSRIGDKIHDRPVRCVAICFGIGVLMGLISHSRD
jgi:hypothetical protein